MLGHIPTQAELRPYYGMATAFDDSNAWLNGQGNLTLGNAGRDDAAADAAALYSKGDVFVNIPLTELYVTGGASAIARAGAGLYTLNLTGAATAYIIGIPLSFLQRKYAGGAAGPANPHGVKVLDLVLGYTVATAALTVNTITFFTEVQTNAAARAVVATPYGAVALENPIGTVVGALPLGVQATPYVARAYGAAPIFVNADNTFPIAEWALTTGAAAAAAITMVGAHLSLALY